MYKFKEIIFSIASILLMVFGPLFFGWWLFFPLSLVTAFFLSKSVEALMSAFILDLFYYSSSHHFPILTIFVLIIILFRIVLRDKLRF